MQPIILIEALVEQASAWEPRLHKVSTNKPANTTYTADQQNGLHVSTNQQHYLQ